MFRYAVAAPGILRALFLALIMVCSGAAARAAAPPAGTHGNEIKAGHLLFQNGAVHVHATWENPPKLHSQALLRIEFRRASDHARIVPPEAFTVQQAFGHGSPIKEEPYVEQIHDPRGGPVKGAYHVKTAEFDKPGDWEIRIVLKRPEGGDEIQAIKATVK